MEMGAWIQVLILGIVQGIAEFLPISSSGHLVILNALLGGEANSAEENLAMNVALHLGTLASILFVYRHELPAMLRNRRLLLAVVLATIPVVVVGLTLKQTFEVAFSTPAVAASGLLVTACFLFLCEWLERDRDQNDMASPTLRQALAIGLFQALALVPGISRSGSTIAGAVMVGVPRELAAKFSFLIAIPAIGGATVLHLRDAFKASSQTEMDPLLLVGAVVSCLVGILALEGLLKIVRKKRLRWFAFYCLLASGATWLWLAGRG
ncbi:MAG: undecaprenyl-diphosphate phosphatase [Planctomycetaceae bacterium]|nr:undecaprenyl-diphosphate phosphatase [Planctomycetaceae bacterium]